MKDFSQQGEVIKFAFYKMASTALQFLLGLLL